MSMFIIHTPQRKRLKFRSVILKDIKKDRGKTKFIFRAIIVLSIIAVFVFCILYTKNQYGWILWGGIIALILLVFTIIIYTFVKWLWDVRDLMTEYRENDNLLSGGFALAATFGFVTIFIFLLSKINLLSDVKDLFEKASALFVAAMPAFIGLLGVQYSVAIQERNRKQDLRLGSKPFFKMQCCKVEAISDENKHTCHTMRIKVKMTNISQSIGIPIKIRSCDSNDCEIALSYNPLANNDHFETEVEVKSDAPYCDKIHIAIFYKDIYENIYESKIEFLQHEKYELSNTQVLHDKLLLNKNES